MGCFTFSTIFTVENTVQQKEFYKIIKKFIGDQCVFPILVYANFSHHTCLKNRLNVNLRNKI